MRPRPQQSVARRSGAWLLIGIVLGMLLHATIRRDKRVEPILETSVPSQNQVQERSRTIQSSPPEQTESISALELLRSLFPSPTAQEVLRSLVAIETLQVKECPFALELIRKLPEDERRMLMSALARRWVALDPQGVFQRLVDREDWFMVEAACKELARLDPEAAVARINDSQHMGFRIAMARAVLPAIAKADPRRAAAFLSERRGGLMFDDDVYRDVGKIFAEASPQEALAWANALPSGKAKISATSHIWQTWAERDPALVAAAIRESPSGPFDRDVYGAIARGWSRTDPFAAVAWIQTLDRRDQLDAAWGSFRPDIKLLGAESTLALISSIPNPEHQAQAASHVVGGMLQHDPAEARAFAFRLPEGRSRTDALTTAYTHMSLTGDPSDAINEAIASLPEGEARSRVLRHGIGRWTQSDPDAALAWIQALPEGKERDETAREALGAMRFDPQRAMQSIGLIQNPERRKDAAQDLVGDWARLDGQAAASWVREQPDAEALAQAHHNVARNWAFTDPVATEQWISALPAGEARDSAIDAFVSTMDGYDPGLATRWAAAIEDPARREQNVYSGFGRWLQRDAGAAVAWLETAEIHEQIRERLASETQRTLAHEAQAHGSGR